MVEPQLHIHDKIKHCRTSKPLNSSDVLRSALSRTTDARCSASLLWSRIVLSSFSTMGSVCPWPIGCPFGDICKKAESVDTHRGTAATQRCLYSTLMRHVSVADDGTSLSACSQFRVLVAGKKSESKPPPKQPQGYSSQSECFRKSRKSRSPPRLLLNSIISLQYALRLPPCPVFDFVKRNMTKVSYERRLKTTKILARNEAND